MVFTGLAIIWSDQLSVTLINGAVFCETVGFSAIDAVQNGDKDNQRCRKRCVQRMYARFFALYALKLQTCAYHVRGKINSTQTDFGFMRNQIKIPLKLSQNDKFTTSFAGLPRQQSKRSYNINAAFDHSTLHIM